MLIDRLLENWKLIEDIFNTNPQSAFKKLYLSEVFTLDQLKQYLRDSVVFKIDNVFQYVLSNLDGKKMELDNFPNIRPAYDTCWFEWSPENFIIDIGNNANSEKAQIKSCGMQLIKVDTAGEEDLIHFTLVEYSEYLVNGNKTILPGGIGLFACKEDGTPSEIFRPISKMLGTDQGILSTYLAECHTVLLAICLMHCKNMTIYPTEPSAKLQKARERRGKLPLFTFKTLEIKPITKILKEEGESETKGLKYALHICRGHFKDFSLSKGLFGKHKGLYWWDNQVRGNREIGAVIKDYKVSPE